MSTPGWFANDPKRAAARAAKYEPAAPPPPPNGSPRLRKLTPEELRIVLPQQEQKLRELERAPGQSPESIDYQRQIVAGLKSQ